MADCTLYVTLVKRPLWKRVLRFPFVWYRHYRALRPWPYTNGRILALYGAWLMAGLTVSTKSEKA